MKRFIVRFIHVWGLLWGFLSFAHAANGAQMHKIYAFLYTGGEMRTRSMHIIQEYAMVGTKDHFKNPMKSLNLDMRTLRQEFGEILQYCNNKDSQGVFSCSELRKAELSLKNAHKLLKSKPNKEEALAFWKEMDNVRNGINRSLIHLTQELYPDNDTVQGIMYASRLATIAQRYGALYLYKMWGFDRELHAGQQLHYLNRFFPDAINQLAESTEELPEALQKNIAKSLQTIQNNLKFFIIMEHSKHYIPTLIYSKSQSIADRANHIAKDFVDNPIE